MVSPKKSARTAFEVLRPIVRVLRACAISEEDIAAAVEKAFARYKRGPVRGVWLDQDCYLQLADVVMLWAREPKFNDEAGRPRRLNLRKKSPSFGELLRQAGTSVKPAAALHHLQALGSVRLCDGGRQVRLLSHVLLATMGRRFLAASTLNEIREFAETVEHNVCTSPGPLEGRMHREARTASLDPAQFAEVQRFVRSGGQTFLEGVDQKLAACSFRGEQKGGMKYGVGLYVFVDRADKRSPAPRSARRKK
jgi:hypothetical protein